MAEETAVKKRRTREKKQLTSMAEETAVKKRRTRRSTKTTDNTTLLSASTEGTILDNRWSNLPEDLLENVMDRLPYTDHYSMNNVCWSWFHGCKSYYRRSISLPRKQQLIPWLLNIMVDHEGSWSSCKMINPLSKRTYIINMNPLKEKIRHLDNWQVCESKSGYFLLVSSATAGSVSSIGRAGVSPRPPSKDSASTRDIEYYLIMYTPFFAVNNLLELPVLTLKGPILLATFDIDIESSPSNIGFKFFVLGFATNTTISISTCRWGDDKWTSQNIHCGFLLSDVRRWMYSQGKFYYATPDPTIGAFDLDKQEWSVFPVPFCKNFWDIHMIKSADGNHLYIFCYYTADYWSRRLRLDISQQWTSKTRWEKIGNKYGNRVVVFVGNGYKSVIEVGEGYDGIVQKKKNEEGYGGGCCVNGDISGSPTYHTVNAKHLSESANRIYICTGDSLNYASFFNRYKTYPCKKHYGSLATEECVKHMWIETPY